MVNQRVAAARVTAAMDACAGRRPWACSRAEPDVLYVVLAWPRDARGGGLGEGSDEGFLSRLGLEASGAAGGVPHLMIAAVALPRGAQGKTGHGQARFRAGQRLGHELRAVKVGWPRP